MLTDIILKFELDEEEEYPVDHVGFTTEMDYFPDDVILTIGDIELEIEQVSYDVLSRRQTIESVILCSDEEEAKSIRDEVIESLLTANYSVFDIEYEEEDEEDDN
jgi:hypothetical protein